MLICCTRAFYNQYEMGDFGMGNRFSFSFFSRVLLGSDLYLRF